MSRHEQAAFEPPLYEYAVAFVRADGGFDIAERFLAETDADATEHAIDRYDGLEWFVLDDKGKNIHGGTE